MGQTIFFKFSKEIKCINATYATLVTDDVPNNWPKLPNGVYKTQLKMTDKTDDNIAELTFYQENNIRKRNAKDFEL